MPMLFSIHSFDQQHLLVLVDFVEFDFDDFAAAGGYLFSDVGGFDGQFTMATVNENCELHAARTAMIKQGIESGADGAAGIEHVVAQHHVAVVYIKPD